MAIRVNTSGNVTYSLSASSNYLENIFLENQPYSETQRRQQMREEVDNERAQSKMTAEDRNKIVKAFNARERKKKEEEFAKLIKQAKDNGLDSSIGSLEV